LPRAYDGLVVYTTFLLDLTAEGTVRHVPGSLKYRPDTSTVPKNAFVWKVTCDSNGVVAIRALRDQKLVLIAHATYTTKLVDRKQRGSEPTPHQWWLVNEGIGLAMHQAQSHELDETPVSEPIDASERHSMKDAGPSYGQMIASEKKEERQRRGVVDHRENDPEWRGWDRKKPDGKKVLIGVGVVVAASVAVYFAVGYSARKKPTTTSSPATPAPVAAPEPGPVPEPAPPRPPEPPAPRTLDQVIAATPDLDVAKLANHRVRWSDVDVASQTTLAKVEKDPAGESGKRVCADGTIERITKKELAGRPHFEGALVTKDGDRVVFVASGSTGELVKRDSAKLCGVVIGSVAGSAHVFGMFDLPENRNPIVEKD
jgi:hypothetical protein